MVPLLLQYHPHPVKDPHPVEVVPPLAQPYLTIRPGVFGPTRIDEITCQFHVWPHCRLAVSVVLLGKPQRLFTQGYCLIEVARLPGLGGFFHKARHAGLRGVYLEAQFDSDFAGYHCRLSPPHITFLCGQCSPPIPRQDLTKDDP